MTLTTCLHTNYIYPEWPAPLNVKAAVTTRQGGFSDAPFDSFNLASHVGDNPEHVARNRAVLKEQLNLASEPVWLSQTHSATAIEAGHYTPGMPADASYTSEIQRVCVVLTADCLPLLVCNRQGRWVAAIHAGWQGLANGVIEAGITAYPGNKSDLLVWLGPAIGPTAFEVQQDVIDACTHDMPAPRRQQILNTCFRPVSGKPGYFLGNLYELARERLHHSGVTAVYGGSDCTVVDSTRYFSYRRDGQSGQQKTGRMASLIWLTH